jgi:hypothetical protein
MLARERVASALPLEPLLELLLLLLALKLLLLLELDCEIGTGAEGFQPPLLPWRGRRFAFSHLARGA